MCYEFDFPHFYLFVISAPSLLEITNIMPLTNQGNRQWPWWASTSSCQTENIVCIVLYQNTITFSPMPFCVLQNNSWFYWTGHWSTHKRLHLYAYYNLNIRDTRIFACMYIYCLDSCPLVLSIVYLGELYVAIKNNRKNSPNFWNHKIEKKFKKLKNPFLCFIGDMIGNFGGTTLDGCLGIC
jgi:hypothetical protein